MSYTNPLPNVKGMTSLKVDNLANRTSYSTLKRVFEAYGPVGDVYIPQNHLTKERYGFAFIHFLNKRDAKNATDALNGILLDGCKLRVQMMHNNDPRYIQPDYAQRGQHQYEEDNHESQSHSEKDCCPTDMIQSTSHSTYSSDHLQSGTQSHYLHRRLSSTRRSKSKSSMSNQQLPDKSRPRSRNLTHAKGKKSKSRSSCRNPSKCPEGGGENMENEQRKKEDSDSEVIFVRSYISKERRSEKRTAHHMRITNRDVPKTEPCVESKEDPLHDMLLYDIDSSQSTTFVQHEVMAEEEQTEHQSWREISLNKSQDSNFMKGDSVNNNYENPALKYDHLYFARLLGEENMENNQKQVKNVGSNSLFKRPHISEGNTTETSMEVVPTRSQIRRRQENPDNCRERPWMERELMEYNKRQREYPQSQSTLTTESKEDEPEIVMVYNRFQKRARTNLQLPKANDWNRCGANTSNVVPGGESERGQHTSFRQSEGQTQRETVRCGFSKTKYQSNTKNYISEEMRFTFNNENLNPENDYALLSRLRSHGSNRNSQTQINHLQPKSTYTPEEGTTEILVDNTMSRDRECTRSESPDVVIVGEVNESRIPQPSQHAALMEANHHESDETFSDLNMDEPCPLCRLQVLFPLSSEFKIIREPRYSVTSSLTTAHTENTAYRYQSMSVTPTDKEDTNISLHSGQTNSQNYKINSVAQTSNTGLDSTVSTATYGTSGQIMTEYFGGEHDNYTEASLEARESFSSKNSRNFHSGESGSSSFFSRSISQSSSNSRTIYPLASLSRPSQQFLTIPMTQEYSIVSNRNLPAVVQTNEYRDEPILIHDSTSEAIQEPQLISSEESDDSDSSPSVPDFTNFNNVYNNNPKGLTKEHIATLPIRAFSEKDKLSACSICLTEYTENSKILTLTCFHEYHDACIVPWLSENSTCPICRRQILNAVDTELLST